MEQNTPSFTKRREEIWRIASMLEAMTHDIKTASDFLVQEAARMGKAEERFAKKIDRRSTSRA